MPATMIPIQSITLTGSAASVTFSAIPQTYTDLVIRWTGRSGGSSGGGYYITFNGTGGTVYSRTSMTSNGTLVESSRSTSAAFIQYVASFQDPTFTANTFDSNEMYIPNYAGSTHKPTGGGGTMENNATTSWMNVTAGLFGSTAAITSVTITGQNGNVIAGSTFHLYGIKNS